MPSPRVLVLYNQPVLPPDHPDVESEHEVLVTADVVTRTLREAHFEAVPWGLGDDPEALIAHVRAGRFDVVFNLYEGKPDDGQTEACVAGLLEWLQVPFTGCPSPALSLARTKHLCKYLFQGAGLPTAPFAIIEELPVAECDLNWPVIVKPALQDASVGLDQGSVVTDPDRLQDRVAYLLKNYGPPVLVEEYIRGRELNVSLIETPELRVLPISEVLFVHEEPGYWPIVTYDAKWKPGSHEFEATPPRYPADVSPELGERVGDLARQAYRLLGCRDYARVDLRVTPEGEPYILEVNPNPDFNPTAGLAGVLGSGGISHAQFTVDLVRTALARNADPSEFSSYRSLVGVK